MPQPPCPDNQPRDASGNCPPPQSSLTGQPNPDPDFCLKVFGRQRITGEKTPPQCMPPTQNNGQPSTNQQNQKQQKLSQPSTTDTNTQPTTNSKGPITTFGLPQPLGAPTGPTTTGGGNTEPTGTTGTDQPSTSTDKRPQSASSGLPTSQKGQEPAKSDQPSAGNSGGEGGQVQKQKKYEPPAAALSYRGNEIELIEFYAQPVPDPDAIVRIDKVGENTIITFADGTIKSSKAVPFKPEAFRTGEGKQAYIIPGTNTPLDRLGVVRVDIPDPTPRSGMGFIHVDGPLISYRDGSKIDHWAQEDDRWLGPLDLDDATVAIKSIDSKGKEVGTVYVDNKEKETRVGHPDYSVSVYKADGSYVTAWPPKADGSRQFYDSKQQKLFVRDANGNIIPPKE